MFSAGRRHTGFFAFEPTSRENIHGDGGSVLPGFIAGTLMLLFTERIGRWSIAAIVIFGLPILDTAVALVRRFINKKPLFVSDRGHIYDQFMDLGLGLHRSVNLCYLLAGLYAIVGLGVELIRFRYAIVVFLAVVVLSEWLVWRNGFLQIPEKSGD